MSSPNVEAPLICLPPQCHICNFSGGRGERVPIPTSERSHQVLPPPPFSFPRRRPIRKGSTLCTVGKGFTADFPYHEWRPHHPRADGNIVWGADIAGFRDRMSLCRIHLKKLVCQAANQGLYSFERHLGFFNQWFKVRSPQPWNPMACVQTGELVTGIRLHCTADQEPKAQPIRKKKENPNAKKVIGNVGRLIPYNYIQMISENGEDMGRMSRWKAIKIMEERDLKLVVFREDADPPMYKLMTGKQIFEEQTKLREKQKLSSGPSCVQVKEMSFLASIEKHDLDIKKKQLAQWIEKKYHVRVTVTKRHAADGPGKEDVLQNLLKSLQNQATCLSEPKERKDGRAVVCILRPLSAKELQKMKKDLESENRKEQISTPKTKLEQSLNPELTNS